MKHVIGIGEMGFSDQANDSIVTHALSTCVAVTAYCRKQSWGGMIHIALPIREAKSSPNKKGYYANEGLPLFLDTMLKKQNCRPGSLELQVYGGADSIHSGDIFNIGRRNLKEVESILKDYGFSYKLVATGGYVSRTIELSIATGRIEVFELPLRL